jgi:hypothetical protein
MMPSLCVCDRNLYGNVVRLRWYESVVKDFDLFVVIMLFRLHP